MDKQIKEWESQVRDLEVYIYAKIRAKDWHAVSDAANDIRELEASITTLRTYLIQQTDWTLDK